MIIILKDSDPRTTRSQGPRTTSAFVLYKDLPLQYISTSKYVCLRSSRLFRFPSNRLNNLQIETLVDSLGDHHSE